MITLDVLEMFIQLSVITLWQLSRGNEIFTQQKRDVIHIWMKVI